MPRMRRMFADGLTARQDKMMRGLEGVAASVAAGQPPEAADLEELFLASHSLKGTAPGFGAEDLGWVADRLCRLVKPWSPETPPDSAQLEQARAFLDEIAREAGAVVERADQETPPE